MNEDRQSNSLMAQVDRGVLGIIQEVFRASARRIRNRMVNRTNSNLAVRFGAVEISHLGRVLERIQTQDGGAFATFRFGEQGLPGLMVVQGPLLYRMVGIMLGEDLTKEVPLYHWRPLTRVDLQIARRLCVEVLGGIQEAIQMDPVPQLTLETISDNPRVRLPLPQGSTVVEVSLDFGPPDQPFGLMSIIVPGQSAGVLWPDHLNRPSAPVATDPAGFDRVMPVPVTVVAELARVKMSLSKVQDLRPGALIDLGFLREVMMRVGDRPLLAAEAGESDGLRSVRITRRLAQLEDSAAKGGRGKPGRAQGEQRQR